MNKELKDVFISYSHQDQEAKDELVALLKQEGISYWLDETSLLAGDIIQDKINEGLRESRYTILLVSKNSLLSTWVSYESLMRLKQEIFENQNRFIAIIIDKAVFDDKIAFKMYDNFEAEIENQEQLRQEARKRKIKTELYNTRIERLEEILPQITDIIHKIVGKLAINFTDESRKLQEIEKLLNTIDKNRQNRILVAQKQAEEAQRQKEIEEKQIRDAEKQKKIEENKKLEAQKQKEIQEKLKSNAKKQKSDDKKPIVIDRRYWLGGGLLGLLGLFLMLGQWGNLGNSNENDVNPIDTTKKTENKEVSKDSVLQKPNLAEKNKNPKTEPKNEKNKFKDEETKTELKTEKEPKKTTQITTNFEKFLPKMIYVAGGTFQMGNNEGDDDEKPIHQVTLSSFYIAETEVTQELYTKVMGNNPSFFQNCPQCPVEQVSWDDAQVFIRQLNKLTQQNYRLPTEAEWEYAARGGKQSQNYKYAGSNNPGEVAWYDKNSSEKTHLVKTKKNNELGIYDMSGNVREWCSDWYGPYSANAQTNPRGPVNGKYRCLRGGSWNLNDYIAEVLMRSHSYPNGRFRNNGFRLLRTL
jgi:formylglycine-generating enzyme required for sulfatase activity